jgi:hypothetical protein
MPTNEGLRPHYATRTRKETVLRGYSGICEWCGEVFLARRKDAKFCPDKNCRVKSYDHHHPDRRRKRKD